MWIFWGLQFRSAQMFTRAFWWNGLMTRRWNMTCLESLQAVVALNVDSNLTTADCLLDFSFSFYYNVMSTTLKMKARHYYQVALNYSDMTVWNSLCYCEKFLMTRVKYSHSARHRNQDTRNESAETHWSPAAGRCVLCSCLGSRLGPRCTLSSPRQTSWRGWHAGWVHTGLCMHSGASGTQARKNKNCQHSRRKNTLKMPATPLDFCLTCDLRILRSAEALSSVLDSSWRSIPGATHKALQIWQTSFHSSRKPTSGFTINQNA